MTWGDAHGGGSSSSVQDQLRNVQHIQSMHLPLQPSLQMDPW